MPRLIRVAIIVTLTITVLLILGVTPALADSCPGGSGYHNLGYTRGYNMYGGHARASEQNYFALGWQNGGFVIQRLLVVSGVESNNYWAEIGFGHGFHGQDVMHFYQARINPSTPYQEFMLSKPPGGAGTYHTYQIDGISSGTWSSKIDGTTWATRSGFHTFSNWQEFGGEATSDGSAMPDTSATELWYKASNGLWYQWSTDSTKTKCGSDDPYQWAWTAFPNSGHFWK